MTKTEASNIVNDAALEVGLSTFTPEVADYATCFMVHLLAPADSTLTVSGIRYRAKKMAAALQRKGLVVGSFKDNSGYRHASIVTTIYVKQ
jgi:hypothetical protein